jgi:hypothetical protein
MAYTPPAGDNVIFDFTGVFTPPAGDNVILDISDAGDQQKSRHRIDFAYAVDTLQNFRHRFDFTYAVIKKFPGHQHRLNLTWAVTPANTARVPFDIIYGVDAAGNHRHRIDFSYSTYGITKQTLPFDFVWSISMRLAKAWELTSSWRVAAAVKIDSQIIDHRVAKAWTIDSTNGRIAKACALTSPLFTRVAKATTIDAPYRDRIAKAWELSSRSDIVNPIRKAWRITSPLLALSNVVTVGDAYATIKGMQVKVLDVELNVDEGGLGWTSRMSLANLTDYILFTSGALFDIEAGGETYTMLFDGKERPRTGATDRSAVVSGISPAAKYADPRATRITKTWTTPILASALAAELFPGEAITWGIVDWTIPAPRLAAQDEAPASIMKRVLAAAGALLECTRTGALTVRYRYPVSVPAYASHTPEQVYTDADHNFDMQEGVSLNTLVNKLRIMDTAQSGFQDRVEWLPDADGVNGTLKVWPQPWRETFNVEHTSLPIVLLQRIGVVTESVVDEVVEVVGGKGTFAKPVYSLDSFAFLYADLGGIVVPQDESSFVTTSTTAFESLVKATYTTRYVKYRARAWTGAKVQFVVREPNV